MEGKNRPFFFRVAGNNNKRPLKEGFLFFSQLSSFLPWQNEICAEKGILLFFI